MTGKDQIQKKWQKDLYRVIFEANTLWGRAFDVVLLWSILISVLATLLESVEFIREDYGKWLISFEWFFTILFTIEYILRIIAAGKTRKYVTSFYGILDLVAILPTYLSLIFVSAHYLMVIRAIRLLRIFRVLKISRYLREGEELKRGVIASIPKITVFLFAVFTIVIIMGAAMYVIEGPENGFDSIPRSMYWAIVTLTTVGYGNVVPHTIVGQMLAGVIMILGYGIIAVPTGIVSAEFSSNKWKNRRAKVCRTCVTMDHEMEAIYCKHCGERFLE